MRSVKWTKICPLSDRKRRRPFEKPTQKFIYPKDICKFIVADFCDQELPLLWYDAMRTEDGPTAGDRFMVIWVKSKKIGRMWKTRPPMPKEILYCGVLDQRFVFEKGRLVACD